MKKTPVVLLLLIFASLSMQSFADPIDKVWHDSPIDKKKVKIGKKTFRRKGCKGCHVIGNFKNKKLRGPDLMDVTIRRTRSWLEGWLKDPRVYIKNKDPIIVKLLAEYPTKMPYLKLKPEQIDGLLEYLKHESIKVKKKHKK